MNNVERMWELEMKRERVLLLALAAAMLLSMLFNPRNWVVATVNIDICT